MQQAVRIRKPCQRAHQRGQEEVISVCLNKDCQIRLACVNCSRDGYHKDHPSDLSHFDYLQVNLEKEIADYHNAGILALIDQKRKQFKDTKADVLKTLDLLEADFLQVIERATKADRFVRESIKMVETRDFLLFKENQAQALVDLKGNSMIQRLKRLVAAPIIQELQSFNQTLLSKLESAKINEFVKKHCQDALQVEAFEKNRLNYDSEMAKEMKLILEERISELNESNSFYLGGFVGDLKHGRGILVNGDSQQILEGLWENNNLKWGTQLGANPQKINFIFVGSFQNGNKEGKGIYKWSNGDIYEGDWKNDKIEGKGIKKWSNGDIYEGDWKNGNKEGKGIYKWSNGDIYEGDWKNNQKVGKGIYKWPNGDIYEGDWKNNQKVGKGIYKWPNGQIYEGDWKNDKIEGKGIYKYSNGEIEEGLYKAGLPIGEHKVYKPTSQQPFKIKIYGEGGNLKETKMLE